MKKGDSYSLQFVVSQKIYKGFIHLFNDNNPLHTNAGFAKEKGFEDVVMHGNILGGFISYFIGESLPKKNVIILEQEIKYLKPVFLGNTLFYKADLVDFFESVNIAEFKFSFKNTSDITVAKGKVQIKII